jgi:hypothetical protein
MRPLALLGFTDLVLLSSSAWAQSDEAKAQAVQRYEEGNVLHNAGKEEDAYVRFAQAYAVIQTPPVIFNLARTEQTTGRLLEAARHYREYLAHPPHPKMTAQTRAKATAFLADVNAKLAHLVVVAPSGAVITVDGKVLAPTDVPDVLPGEHTVAVQFGDQGGSVHVVAAAGAATHVQVPLSTSPQNVDVPIAPPPVAATPAPAVPPAQPSATSSTFFTTRNTLALALGAVAVGTLSAGVGLEVAGSNDSDRAAQIKATLPTAPTTCGAGTSFAACQSLSAANSSAASAKNAATALFVTGGIAAVGAAAVLLLWPSTPSSAGSSGLGVVPMVSPKTAGVQWVGAF